MTVGTVTVSDGTNKQISLDGYRVSTDNSIYDLTGKKLGQFNFGYWDNSTHGTGRFIMNGGYTTALDSPPVFYDKDGAKIPQNALVNYFESSDGINVNLRNGRKVYDCMGVEVKLSAYYKWNTLMTPTEGLGVLELKLHVGADATSNNQISIRISSMSATGIGVKNVRVDGDDDSNALEAIGVIKEAIQKISTQRSALGAAQNRLDHTINNLDNVVENTTSAESAIRDTDMATTMVEYSNNSILAQAGQAMLAQANQSNQGVLNLLG